MAVPFLKIFYTPPGGVEREITEKTIFKQKRGLQIKSSTADFNVTNTRFKDKDGGQSIFQEDGQVEIYLDYDPITRDPSQLIFSGQVREISQVAGEDGSQFKISAADKTVLLLGGIWSFTYTNQSPSDIIKSIVQQITENDVTTENVATKDTGGSDFDTLNSFSLIFKPAYEWINELSQVGYTGENRPYLFYVDSENDLHWFYPAQTSTGTLTEGTDEIYEVNMSRSSDDVVNQIFFNAGQDLEGNGIMWYFFDTTTTTNTLRSKYEPMIDIGRDMIDREIAISNLTQSSSGTVPYQGKLYSAVASGTTDWGTSFSDFDDYNDVFRTRAKNLGTERSDKITKRFGNLRWKGSVDLKGTKSYSAGDLPTVNLASAGISDEFLRVHDVRHTIDDRGWTTTIDLEEDEAAIAARSV